ncbi:hypothetical protein [Olivibacter domesticus]|uniref:Uncharacterized protein n=1 Tax=Olivibacter domesticus TaxID=407022 RepID=A0A1H7UU71_OLID1|nr:hypothetical protein [Olivibacter domesticus]SEM00235.1 hypothetical protein SAMN05661044_03937 [Olivibacter domesticus]
MLNLPDRPKLGTGFVTISLSTPTAMCLTLESLGALLEADVQADCTGTFRYITLKDDYIISENLVTKELEVNDLHIYEWESLSMKHLKGMFHGEPLKI